MENLIFCAIGFEPKQNQTEILLNGVDEHYVTAPYNNVGYCPDL